MRPRTSSAAASSGDMSSAPSWSLRVGIRGGRGGVEVAEDLDGGDELDALVEHDLAVERPVDRALGGDLHQALDLVLLEAVREADDELEPGRAAALGGRVLAVDLHGTDVPALALGVHLERDRGARGQGSGQQLLGAGGDVVAARVEGLVRADVVVADADVVLEGVGPAAAGCGSHDSRVARRSTKGLKIRPVSSLGKKNVDLGGMLSPAAATSRTCSTGVARMKNAQSDSPRSTMSSASAVSRAYPRPCRWEMSSSLIFSAPLRTRASRTAVSRRR